MHMMIENSEQVRLLSFCVYFMNNAENTRLCECKGLVFVYFAILMVGKRKEPISS